MGALRVAHNLEEVSLAVKITDADRVASQNAHEAVAGVLPNWPNLRLLRLPDVPPPGGRVLDAIDMLCAQPPVHLQVLKIPGVDSVGAANALVRAVRDHLPQLTHLDLRPSSAIAPTVISDLRAILQTRSAHAELTE